MRRKTTVWSASPRVLEHPVGPATQLPKIRRVSWYISGLDTRKKSSAATNDTKNFASCFLPSQPQPQSGNMLIYNMLRKYLKTTG